MFKEIKKFFEGISKPYEGFFKAVGEAAFFLLGVSIEGGKAAKSDHGLKGTLFILPFIAAFVIIFFLLAKSFIIE